MPLGDRFRTALVTGARSGLGAAFVELLLREGVKVWGTARNPAVLSPRPRFSALPLELADPESVASLWDAAERASGGIDLLINNAGAGVFGPSTEVGTEVWEEQQAVLFAGPAQLTRLACPAMKERGRGGIVNVTSLAVEFPIPYMCGYNAGKAALAAFTTSLADEVSGSGVFVIDFRAGDFHTGFHAAMRHHPATMQRDDTLKRTWERLEAIQRRAPAPDRAARDLRRALRRGRSGSVRSGSFFQAQLAPWGNRLLPRRVLDHLRRAYFGISR